MNIYWMVLFLAVVVEIGWALSLKFIYSDAPFWPIVACVVLTLVNIILLSYAMKGIPVGTAYAVWTGLGAVGIAICGMIWFGDPFTYPRVAFMAMIVVGVIGLKLSSS